MEEIQEKLTEVAKAVRTNKPLDGNPEENLEKLEKIVTSID